jgi:hypothetical protein
MLATPMLIPELRFNPAIPYIDPSEKFTPTVTNGIEILNS